MSLTEESRRVVLKWFECVNEGRHGDLMALGAPDATWWVSGLKETFPLSGSYPYAEREKHMNEVLKGVISFKLTIKDITAEGDTVVVEASPRAETQDGRIYENDAMTKFVIKDGKIQSLREYVDVVALSKFMEGQTA